MGAVVAACGSANVKVAKRTHGKEYFAESKYGVKASPRVVSDLRNIPRGGGRNQVGRPYQVAGKWYYPKEEPGYIRKGRASWYGSAFHGRLTANGEILRHDPPDGGASNNAFAELCARDQHGQWQFSDRPRQ